MGKSKPEKKKGKKPARAPERASRIFLRGEAEALLLSVRRAAKRATLAKTSATYSKKMYMTKQRSQPLKKRLSELQRRAASARSNVVAHAKDAVDAAGCAAAAIAKIRRSKTGRNLESQLAELRQSANRAALSMQLTRSFAGECQDLSRRAKQLRDTNRKRRRQK
jgi:hypothetical protein